MLLVKFRLKSLSHPMFLVVGLDRLLFLLLIAFWPQRICNLLWRSKLSYFYEAIHPLHELLTFYTIGR
jgi:hypothetical protein